MTDLEALVVAAYVFADEYPVRARGGRRPLICDAELVALAVAQAAIGISSDRQFLGLIGRALPGWFPHLPDQSQYNRRLRALVGLISIVQQQLARLLDAGGLRLSDGTLIGVANYPGCQRRSEFAGFARFGFAKSQHRFIYGVRLVLLTDERGLPLGYTVAPANEKEYEPLADLLTGTPATVVIADKGFWGRDYAARLAADGTALLTPEKTRTAANPAPPRRPPPRARGRPAPPPRPVTQRPLQHHNDQPVPQPPPPTPPPAPPPPPPQPLPPPPPPILLNTPNRKNTLPHSIHIP